MRARAPPAIVFLEINNLFRQLAVASQPDTARRPICFCRLCKSALFGLLAWQRAIITLYKRRRVQTKCSTANAPSVFVVRRFGKSAAGPTTLGALDFGQPKEANEEAPLQQQHPLCIPNTAIGGGGGGGTKASLGSHTQRRRPLAFRPLGR